MNLHQERFSLDARQRFFTERVVGHWDRFPREVVMALGLPESKQHLDNALRHVVMIYR